MDGRRFDDLTRLFGISLTRKRFVGFVGGLLGAETLASPSDVAAANKGRKQRRGRGRGVGSQGEPGVCNGFCEKDADCPDVADCVCDESENRCVTLACGGTCAKTADCQNLAGCFCSLPSGREVEGEGALLGECVTDACGGFCDKGLCPDSPGCICDESTNQCVTVACGGSCFKDADCPNLEGCSCTVNVDPSRVGAEGEPPGTCVAAACPGDCTSNPDCTEQGDDTCVCFLGPDVDVAAVVQAEGVDLDGACGVCRGAGQSCDASTECCGQLVCQAGRCQRKQKPKKPKKERCASSGKACSQDQGCCAQAICYRGECGEKDTHCDSDNECARGYSCVGGRLTGGHRRCRRNRRKPPRNRRNRG